MTPFVGLVYGQPIDLARLLTLSLGSLLDFQQQNLEEIDLRPSK
jgi:hypothetical protein